jgi:hypothetical protein
MNKHDKTLQRIHDLFAEKQTPTSLTKDERKELQTEYANCNEAGFSFKAAGQAKNETSMQTYARFEKSVLGALKKAKDLISDGKITNIELQMTNDNVEVYGEEVLSDDELIKAEHKTWDYLMKQHANEAKEMAAAKEAAAKIAEQNALFAELVGLLKKPRAKSKKSPKTAK